jgi:hypothetical protein
MVCRRPAIKELAIPTPKEDEVLVEFMHHSKQE